jgi:hypothetical protein
MTHVIMPSLMRVGGHFFPRRSLSSHEYLEQGSPLKLPKNGLLVMESVGNWVELWVEIQFFPLSFCLWKTYFEERPNFGWKGLILEKNNW